MVSNAVFLLAVLCQRTTTKPFRLKTALGHFSAEKEGTCPASRSLYRKSPVYLPEPFRQVPVPIGQPSFILERIERVLQRHHRQEILIVFKCVILCVNPQAVVYFPCSFPYQGFIRRIDHQLIWSLTDIYGNRYLVHSCWSKSFRHRSISFTIPSMNAFAFCDSCLPVSRFKLPLTFNMLFLFSNSFTFCL